jgi:NAD(P)-dependent dehydrogenase (short-subunit alcohol dehydrogenase family)
MALDLKGKTVFITGGAAGLGLSMARSFGREGAKVMLADVDQRQLSVAKAELESRQVPVSTVICDVTSRDAVRAAALQTVADFGKVHVVVNNAGVAAGGDIGTIADKDWDWIIDVNIKGVVYGVETFAPLIRSHGEGGHVINVASLAGMVAPPRMEPYTATKFAVVAMSEGWAQQLAPHGIGVSVLCPGFARTRIHESFRNKPAKYGAAETASGLGQSREEGAALVNGGIDPDIVGDRVVEAMKAGELYIFTHREAQAFLELRFQSIIDAYKRAQNSEVLKRLPDVDMAAVMQQLQAQQS